MTTQTLRPASEDIRAGVTRTPNVSANTNLDDSPADAASYVIGTYHGARLVLGMGSYTLAAGERVRSATMRAAIFHTVADTGNREYVDLRLRDSATGAVTTPDTVGTVTNTPGITATGAAKPAAPGGGAWTQTRVDNLQVDIGWRASAGTNFLNVYEIYVDLDINTQPTVSSVTASGYTTSTRPSWSFAFADTDNDLQSRYEVKVFSAAQYGAAGFDASTSDYTWSSGQAFGNPTSGTITTDLVNGVTYKFYARAAQDWPGPEGALWWSEWALSSAFTVALSPPQTPTLTASTQTGVPEYRVLLTATAALNLLSENDADLETSVGGWVNDTNATVARSTTNPSNGVGGLQLTAASAATMSARTASGTSGMAVTAGVAYTAVASFRAATTGRSVNVKIRWYDRAGATVSTSSGSNVSDTNVGYTQATVAASAPATAVFAAVVVEVVSPANAEVHRVDVISLHRGTSTTWTTGGMYSTAALLVERAEKVANFRGAATNWAHPQLASGGGLTHGTDGFYSRQTATLRSLPLDQAPMTNADGAGQARMIRWRPITGAFAFLDWGLDNSATTDPSPPYLSAAVVSLQTRMAVWARVSTGTFSTKLFAFSVDATNTIITSTSGGTISLTTTWQRFTVDITPGAGSCYLRGGLENSTPTTEVDVDVTGIRICPTTADDGTTPPGQGIQGLWEEVRTVDTAAPTSPGEQYVLYDHEAPPGRPVLYRVTTQATVSSQAIASAPSAPAAVYMTLPSRDILKDPLQPENAMPVTIQPGTTIEPTEDAQVFHPLGRDADPVIIRDWRSGSDGQLSVFSDGDLARYRLDQLTPAATSLLVQWALGGQTYIRVTRRPQSSLFGPAGYWRTDLTYVETRRPAVT